MEAGHAEKVPREDMDKNTSGVFCHVQGLYHKNPCRILRCFTLVLLLMSTKMYHAVELIKPDRDLHHFLWRPNIGETLQDYRVTFSVSSSFYAGNMTVK